jgi:hypothetical protein
MAAAVTVASAERPANRTAKDSGLQFANSGSGQSQLVGPRAWSTETT